MRGPYKPFYADPDKRDMARLELGEAMSREDDVRIGAITKGMVRNGVENVNDEKKQSARAFSEFEANEKQRTAEEMVPWSAEDMRAEQAKKDTIRELDDFTPQEAELIANIEAAQQEFEERNPSRSYHGDMKVEHAQADFEDPDDRGQENEQSPGQEQAQERDHEPEEEHDERQGKLEFYKHLHPEQDHDHDF